MTYEEQNEVTFGAVETFLPQHMVSQDKSLALGRLSTVLEWKTDAYNATNGKSGSAMSSAIVRGNAYVDMKYINARPRIRARRSLSGRIIIDNNPSRFLECGKDGKFSTVPVLSEREVKIQFDTSDQTWLLFVSEPVVWECSVKEAAKVGPDVPPGVVVDDDSAEAVFELRALRPMKLGMVRGAMANNCSTGLNAESKYRQTELNQLHRGCSLHTKGNSESTPCLFLIKR
jgi:hypothetical protein